MPSPGNTQIACRVCNNVFPNIKALIDHLDSHTVDGDEAATERVRQKVRLSHLMSSPMSNPFFNPRIQLDLGYTTLPHQTSPQIQHQPSVFNQNQPFYSPAQVHAMPFMQRDHFNAMSSSYSMPSPNPYPNLQTYEKKLNAGFGSGFGAPFMVPPFQQIPVPMAVMEDPGDYARPFLNQLEYPIFQKNKFDFRDNCNGSSDELDLDLKL